MQSMIANIVVILVLAVILFFAIRSVIKKKGGCGCGCSSCSCGCGGAKKEDSSSNANK